MRLFLTQWTDRPPDKSVYWKTISLFLVQNRYVVSTQKNHLNETVRLSTQNTYMFKLIDKEIITILRS